MILLAKLALGFTGTVAVAGAYTFHEGVIRVDVDERRAGGSHVHFWVPATAVPVAMRFVPDRQLRHAAMQAREAMPVARALMKELKNYPDITFVEVKDGDNHVKVSTQGGKLRVDVDSPEETVHVAVPV